MSSSITYFNQQLGDTNSHVSAEKAHKPLSKNDVFRGKGYALLSASVSLLLETESTTRMISSGLESPDIPCLAFWGLFPLGHPL